MPQIGTITKYEIPVFERSDVGNPTVGVEADNGNTGYLNLVPYADRDKPAWCCTINGEHYGTKRSVYKIIDDFEDGDNNEYYIPSSSGGQAASKSAALTSGSERGLWLNGPRRMFSMPGDGLPYYPRRGDRFEFWFEPRQFRDTPAFFRFNFGMQGYNTNNIYRLEVESDPTQSGTGSDFSFEKRKNGSNVIIRATGDDTGMRLKHVYRMVVDWGHNSMTATWRRPEGTDRTLSFTDGEYDAGGIGWECNGYVACRFDTCRTIPD